MAARIHPTAIVHKDAQLGDGAVIGPYVVIESDVCIGEGCELMVGAVVHRYTTLGPGNVVGPYSVLGGLPQDYKFDPSSVSYLRIGSENVFREHVTISRATTPGGATVIGNRCFFMTQSHVGHDSVIADRVVLTNGTAVAGHVEIGSGAILSAHTVVHQYCWVGELVMTQGNSGTSQHVPPFCVLRYINVIAGLNVVGLRRAEHIGAEDRAQIKEAYRLLYRSSLTPAQALAEMEAHQEWGAPAGRFRQFLRRVLSAKPPHDRGLASPRGAYRGPVET